MIAALHDSRRTKMERRKFLQLSAGAVASASAMGVAARFLRAQNAPVASGAPGTLTLRQAGAARGIMVGTAVGRGNVDDPAMAALIADQYNIVVCENDMKWFATQPEQARFEFTYSDKLVAFAQVHDQRIRGHNLCWHNQNPEWLASVLTPQNAAQILEYHVRTVVTHFAGKIQSWDVVNEAVLPSDGRKDGLRKTIWLQALGLDYLELAYRAAAAADPTARLTYNDYSIERDNPEHALRRKKVLELLRWFRQKNIPLHAVGIQSHLTGSLVPATWKGLNRFLDEVHDLGLEVYITEMDVEDLELPSDIPARDHLVAQMYRGYLEDVVKHPAVKAVLTWGFTDPLSWLTKSHHQRTDGLPKRTLPFDADLHPKPAFNAMIESLQKG
jgi:endo-1,4-beta-xylanase